MQNHAATAVLKGMEMRLLEAVRRTVSQREANVLSRTRNYLEQEKPPIPADLF